jgi:hypothetical protein
VTVDGDRFEAHWAAIPGTPLSMSSRQRLLDRCVPGLTRLQALGARAGGERLKLKDDRSKQIDA